MVMGALCVLTLPRANAEFPPSPPRQARGSPWPSACLQAPRETRVVRLRLISPGAHARAAPGPIVPPTNTETRTVGRWVFRWEALPFFFVGGGVVRVGRGGLRRWGLRREKGYARRGRAGGGSMGLRRDRLRFAHPATLVPGYVRVSDRCAPATPDLPGSLSTGTHSLAASATRKNFSLPCLGRIRKAFTPVQRLYTDSRGEPLETRAESAFRHWPAS